MAALGSSSNAPTTIGACAHRHDIFTHTHTHKASFFLYSAFFFCFSSSSPLSISPSFYYSFFIFSLVFLHSFLPPFARYGLKRDSESLCSRLFLRQLTFFLDIFFICMWLFGLQRLQALVDREKSLEQGRDDQWRTCNEEN